MSPIMIVEAAQLLTAHWSASTQIAELPEHCRPQTRADGYAIQAEIARISGQATVGWKIAATAVAGQKHINVDGPLAGRLHANRVFSAGSKEANSIDLRSNFFRVLEPEFTFRMARALPKRDAAYTVDEVMNAVASLHLAIEVPDCRLTQFTQVGAASLIADTACACWWIVGDAVSVDWRKIDLVEHAVSASKGSFIAEGKGKNVLGDPRIAMAWIANELVTYGDGLKAGDYVTTGTCVVPVPVAPGDTVDCDFGALGMISVSFP